MSRAGRGFRSGTRSKFSSAKRSKFKPETYLRDFKQGERVAVRQYPPSQSGLPHSRYMGLCGVVKAKRGRAYVVELKLGGKPKTIISSPEHLKRV